ncbi:bolA-like protein DDB_G0274169 isoform X1 [Plodia interpunctella]|uniref:bolA-like protein DDB_G0274169 isoform X1 n=2 Tax=Plodia interpunctella TaxID=58824 RepID=UPI00236808C0|nr:bolA-like protein DDB_G0274169 isoform X1 [Plodia interpunctella]
MITKIVRVSISMSKILRTGYSSIRRMSAATGGPVEGTIRNKLQSNLAASYVDVINESYMHNVPKGAETHFKVVVVSDKFDGLPIIKRHRLVNDTLKEELQNGVHALSIVAKTPQQWEISDKVVESSPNCRGGFGK